MDLYAFTAGEEQMQLSGSGKGKQEKKKQLSGKKEEGEVSDYRDETWVSTTQRT